MTTFFAFCLVFLAQIFVTAGLSVAERYAPGNKRVSPNRAGNIAIGTVLLASAMFGVSIMGPVITLAVDAVGGGLFVLPHEGWGLIAGAAIYLLAMDLGEYLFHRAQHAFPFMWAMHLLHHSDPDLGTTTTIRHFWLEPVIKSLTIWLAVGVLFKASLPIVVIYGAISYYHFITHANLRLNFHGASWLLNSSAYHRVHHSAQQQHFDRNFAALLPIFDVLSGSYYQPGAEEYPDTGLDTGAKPQGVMQAVTWPLRGIRIPHKPAPASHGA